MHQAGDRVAEIATEREGEVKITQSDGSRGNGVTTEWQVLFDDGTKKTFHDESELQSLVEKPGPGISPTEPLQ